MDADIQGCLDQINRSYRAFEHKGESMTKAEVKAVLEYGISKGYKAVSELSDNEIDNILTNLKQTNYETKTSN